MWRGRGGEGEGKRDRKIVRGKRGELGGNMKELGLLAAVRSRVISSSYTCVYLFPLGNIL